MNFIKECLKGNGTIRAIIVAVLLAVTLVPVICDGLAEEVKSYESYLAKEAKEIRGN